MQDLGERVASTEASVADAQAARLRNRAGVMGYTPRSTAPATTMSFVGECRGAAKVTVDTKPAQNDALLCARKSLRLIFVGAKSTVRIT
jgi:hypothetical protein